jgi:uncharacterized membrane protein
MLDPVLSEWTSQLLRWVHVITAIAWIGSSFYFIHLDLSLRKRAETPEGEGITGEAWQVHGGGFYQMRKYTIAPPALPEHLTWFKWESYATWLSGFFLLVWVYYLGAEMYLIDPAVMPLKQWQAAAIGLGGIAASWFIYDGLCRSPLGRNDKALWLVGLIIIMAAAWGFGQVFGARGAFLHAGAMIATWMSASVFFVIIPNQRKAVADMLAGRVPDPKLGKEAKQRSLHNNYLTLPVVFVMLSSHYPLAWQSAYAWAILGLIVVAGALIRHFFNTGHAGGEPPYWTWVVAALAVMAAIWLSVIGAPGRVIVSDLTAPARTDIAALTPPALAAMQNRCTVCHAKEPAWNGIVVPPNGIRLETASDLAIHAPAVKLQAVLTHAMPPHNLTQMTQDERRALALWFAAHEGKWWW